MSMCTVETVATAEARTAQLQLLKLQESRDSWVNLLGMDRLQEGAVQLEVFSETLVEGEVGEMQ